MSKFKESPRNETPVVPVDTREEYEYLRKGMATFAAKKINGRMYGKFEQFMESIGVVRFSEKGYMEISDPFKYTKYNRMNANIEWRDTEDMKKMHDLYPELKEEHNEKLSTWFKEIRELISKWKIA